MEAHQEIEPKELRPGDVATFLYKGAPFTGEVWSDGDYLIVGDRAVKHGGMVMADLLFVAAHRPKP